MAAGTPAAARASTVKRVHVIWHVRGVRGTACCLPSAGLCGFAAQVQTVATPSPVPLPRGPQGFLRAHSLGQLPPATGTDDKQADCVARLAPLVAAFGGDPQLLVCVEAATRVTQNQDEAVAWALAGAAVLERLLLGGLAPSEAVERTVQELQAPTGAWVWPRQLAGLAAALMAAAWRGCNRHAQRCVATGATTYSWPC